MRVLSGLLLVASLSLVGGSSVAEADTPVIELERIDIIGTSQRPNAFYILERVHGRDEVVDLRTTFTDEIVRDAGGVDR